MSLLAIRLDKAFPRSDSTSTAPHASLAPLLHLVDEESAAQVQRFRRLEDAQRCLVGRLLPRYVLASSFGLPWSALTFGRTAKGRPHVTHSDVPRGFDFSVSHDSNWVVLASVSPGSPGRLIGVDVMRVKIPWEGETADDFVEGLKDQLTDHEQTWLRLSISSMEQLRRVFALWTLKEAYTKAIGEGLSMDLKRLEFRFASLDPLDGVIGYLDGQEVEGWSFELLELDEEHFVAVARLESSEKLSIQEVTLSEMLVVAELDRRHKPT